MVEINITYEGDLHCRAVHGPSGVVIETDAPVDNHGKGESFSPTDLFATSLGVCNMTLMGICAKGHKIELMGTKIRVEKHMSAELPRRVARLVIDIKMAPGIPVNKREIIEHAARTCPVALSVSPEIIIEQTFNYPD
jgi:putative redox protein